MEPGPRAEIEEIVRRLMRDDYQDENIREAAEVIVGIQTHAESLGMGEEFLASPFAQVAKLGIYLLQALSAGMPKAAEILAKPEVQEQIRKLQPAAPQAAPRKPGYEAMAEIIKMWMREDRQRSPKKLSDWLPRP
jgi:hypothetical protein